MSENSDIVFVQLTPAALQTMLEKASTLGAIRAMTYCGAKVKDMLSRKELSDKFGRGKVDRMIKSGKLTPYRIDENSRSKYKLSEVVTLFN